MTRSHIASWGMALLAICFAHASLASVATYRLTVVNEWNPTDYPFNYPANGHFSNLGGGTHEPQQSYWEPGELSSSQIEIMAEGGNVSPISNLIANNGGEALVWAQWFCREGFNPPACGTNVKEFTINSETSAVTLTTMIAPSPDWFVGVSGLNLRSNGAWIQSITVPLPLWDAGTENGNTPTTSNPPTSPEETIQLISYNSGTGFYDLSTTADVVGSFTFELISVEGDDDSDGDSVGDSFDNCMLVANESQLDSDGDGFGNACDADTNNDCIVNFLDVGQFSNAFLSNDSLHDFNGDGVVNFVDLITIRDSFLSNPGPSALTECTS